MISFRKKTKNPFVAVLFGLLMVPGSVALHAWNEYRTVHRSRGLLEAQRDVKSVPDVDLVDDGLDGKLIHFSGRAETDEILSDAEFGLELNAIRLARRVEMYQWEEDSHTRDNRTTYSHSKTWKEGRINSESFHERSGHENPVPHWPSIDLLAKHVEVGSYELSTPLKQAMTPWVGVEMNADRFTQSLAEKDRSNVLYEGRFAYWSQAGKPDPKSPQVGDLRVYFEKVEAGNVSVIGKQAGSMVEEYTTSNGERIQRLYSGLFSAAEVIDKLKTENTVLAFVLRIVGFVVCFVGFLLTLSPIRSLASFIPIIGELTGGLVFFVSILLAFVVSSTTIAIAWIAVHPLFGIGTLLLVGLAIYALYRVRRKHPPHTNTHPPILEPI